MKGFSSEQIEQINANARTGRFVEAVIFARDETTKDYFVRNGKPVYFNGSTYQPLDFVFSGIKVTNTMELPTVQVTVSNLGGQVLAYIEDNDIDIETNDVWLQILFIDKFNKVTLVDEMLFQVETMVADYNTAATFNLGVNYSLNDPIPRYTLEKQEFPGLRDDVIRVGT